MRIRTLVCMLIISAPYCVLAVEDVRKSGKQLYEQYCAACHGIDGRGDGPVSKSLAVEVPDLTRFAQRRGNFFHRELIERVIDGRHIIGAHGSRTMPVWGEDFSRAQIGDPQAERSTRLVITRLADYLWQLQRPQTRQE